MYNILEYNSLRNIIPLQYEEIVRGLDNCERMQDGFRLEFTDKNYNCLPYLDAVLDSRTHGLSFFQDVEAWILEHKWQELRFCLVLILQRMQ